jgi:hypothetical protein
MKSRKDKTVSVTTSLLLIAAVVLSPVSCATHAGELEKNAVRFVGSVAVGAGATTLLKESEHPVLYGAAVGAAPSVVKELIDTSTKHGASGQDLVIGFAGAALGAVVAGKMLEGEDLAPIAATAIAGPFAGGAMALAVKEESTRADALNVAVGVASMVTGGIAGAAIAIGWVLVN